MKNEDVISKLLVREIPKLLFHYTSGVGLKGIIETGKIWTTKIHYLNDRLELELAFEYIRDEINHQINSGNTNHSTEELTDMLGALDSISKFNVSVASFTTQGDQLSQWRGYSEIGNGYSLGFDGQRLNTQVIENGNYHLTPCLYEQDEHQLLVKYLVDTTSVANILHNPNYGKPPFYKLSFAEAALFIAPIIKSEHFREEQEWRLISVPLNYDDAKFRAGNYSLIPYWEFDLGIMDSLNRVIIGPTPERELSERALYGLLTQRHLFNLGGILHSEIPFRKI